VLLVAFAVTAFILIFVIPVFEDLFRSFGADLPAFTRLVIDISHVVRDYWWLVLGILVGSVIAFLQARRRSRKFHQFTDRLLLRIPVFGNLARQSATARFSRTLATMFDSGVPLVEALASVAGATGNIVYQEAVMEMRNGVSIGQQLNFTMRQTSLFSDMVVQMVAIGEDSGALGSMLDKVAHYYEEELDNTISSLMTLIEPTVMVILGVLVGGLVVAMYLPIFKLAMAI
jgi:type IV pilus assembly protein PilC